MDNDISKIVSAGLCTGCSACDVCEHITFAKNALGFPVPAVGGDCTQCGRCLSACIYALDSEDD